MSATELSDRYEQIRRTVTLGESGPTDGLVVLRRQGLHAWIAQVGSAPVPSGGSKAPEPSRISAEVDRSPMVSLCADILLAKLKPQEVR